MTEPCAPHCREARAQAPGAAGAGTGAELRHSPLRRLALAGALTAGFMLVEAAVGWWAQSLALLADAGHMLADAAALALAIAAQRIATRDPTRARTYGHRRAEVLAAFVNGIALAVVALWVFKEAAQRWTEPRAILAGPMLVTALGGLVVNALAALVLWRGQAGKNLNTKAALFHVLSDGLGSLGALAAAILVLGLGWLRADAAAGMGIGVLVLYGGWRLLRETTHVLMEGAPTEVDLAAVERTLLDVPGVVGLHDLHLWCISDGFNVLTVHVVIGGGQDGAAVAAEAGRALGRRHGILHVTVQPEPQTDERLAAAGRGPEPGTAP
ncbi:MAG: cation transporter [Deltaproteobacteria bacterium]|nr:cation transporter [Deltaproteobacteria bacterium]